MDQIEISKLAYISTTVLLAFISGGFFLLSPLGNFQDKRPILTSFSLFFFLSGMGFLLFIVTLDEIKLITVVLNQAFFILSFCFLKKALVLRKGRKGYRITKDIKSLTYIAVGPLINGSLYLINPDSVGIRTGVSIGILTLIVASTFKYVFINKSQRTFGEKVMKNTLVMSLIFMLILIVVIVLTRDLYIYLTVLTVTFTLLLASLLGAIQTLLLGDLSNLYKQDSITDYLTGLNNRRHFISRTNELIKLAERKPFPCCVILLDIDDFKKVNDAYGHGVGDEVLKYVSETLRSNVRESDVAARIGGEEFCVTLPNTGVEAASELAERIRTELNKNIIWTHPKELKVQASFGISEISIEEEGCVVTNALNQADKALYRSKAQGKNRVSIERLSMS
ncbi:GGDEF domain-containing protein [Paraglaciecola sp.]|uniref:GGDEF domain-containing protein n=1 Tax=Paraglaciecola sp. TaxID=1920173 RepID=UPI003EF8F51B